MLFTGVLIRYVRRYGVLTTTSHVKFAHYVLTVLSRCTGAVASLFGWFQPMQQQVLAPAEVPGVSRGLLPYMSSILRNSHCKASIYLPYT